MENKQEMQNQVEFLCNSTAKQLYSFALYTVGNQMAAEHVTIKAFSDAFHSISDKSDVNLFKKRSFKLLYEYGKKIQRKRKSEHSIGYTTQTKALENIRMGDDVEKSSL